MIVDWGGAGGDVVGALRADAADARREGAAAGRPRESSGRDVAAAGADERLAAPFSPLQLQVKLRRLLGADAVGA